MKVSTRIKVTKDMNYYDLFVPQVLDGHFWKTIFKSLPDNRFKLGPEEEVCWGFSTKDEAICLINEYICLRKAGAEKPKYIEMRDFEV